MISQGMISSMLPNESQPCKLTGPASRLQRCGRTQGWIARGAATRLRSTPRSAPSLATGAIARRTVFPTAIFATWLPTGAHCSDVAWGLRAVERRASFELTSESTGDCLWDYWLYGRHWTRDS
jgi:hypothetical protein